MAEGKKGPRSPGVPDGWESDSSPDDYRNYSSSGRGATTADRHAGESGEGDYDGGRGTDYPVPPGGADNPRAGETQPEFPPEGWGGPGENYPPTQGPLGEPARRRERGD